jgi:hypothetical protein
VKKSQASIVVACARKNSAHVGPERRDRHAIFGIGAAATKVLFNYPDDLFCTTGGLGVVFCAKNYRCHY